MRNKQNMPQRIYQNIAIGFATCSVLLLAITHQSIAYLGLLGLSAIFSRKSVPELFQWVRGFKPMQTATAVGIFAIALNLIASVPASAQWQGAQDAAGTALTPYLGAGIVDLLFTIVFLLLFFLIVGGLMTWGYKAFRNEDAAVPMTAFIVGTVIYVGGEVFSGLFFGNGTAGPAT